MVDTDDLLIIGGVLAALTVGVTALTGRSSGRTVINIPEGFGQSDGGNTGPMDPTPNAPVDLPSPSDDGGASTDVPDEEPLGGRGPTSSPSSSTIPDSLIGFNPASRAELIDDDNQVGL